MSFQLDVLNFKINCIFFIMAIVRKWLYINEIPHLSLFLSNVIFFFLLQILAILCKNVCFYIYFNFLSISIRCKSVVRFIRATRISEWSDAPCVRVECTFCLWKILLFLSFSKRRRIIKDNKRIALVSI